MSMSLVAVPQRLYKPTQGAAYHGPASISAPIAFRAPGGSVMSVSDALLPAKASLIQGANDPIVQKVGYPAIKFYVNWPGYSIAYPLMPISLYSPQGTMSRAMLLNVIAKQIVCMLEKCSHTPCSSKYAVFKVTPGSVTIYNVFINSLVNVTGDIWQADLEVAL